MFMKYLYIILLFLLTQNWINAQIYQPYQTDEITIYSENWNDSIRSTISFPVSMHTAGSQTKYPLLLIFDQQNATTFNYHLQTINFLTGVGAQIPEMIVVGVPFDPDKRWMNTSLKIQANDSMSGIQMTERIIFEELLPKLKARFPINDYLMIAGHSRTAYLASYLLSRHPDQINMAAAFSGFYEDAVTSEKIVQLATGEKKTSHKISYYITAGDSFEEESYFNDYNEMAAQLESMDVVSDFYWRYEVHPHANHISNYGLSLGPVLVDHFAAFNGIMESWFSSKLDQLSGAAAVESLLTDFDGLPYGIKPQLLHVNSIGSGYYSKEDYLTSEKIIDLGLQIYPTDAGLSLFKADLLAMQNKKAESQQYLLRAKQLLETQDFLSEDETTDLWDWYHAIEMTIKEK